MTTTSSSGITTLRSSYPFAETVQRLQSAFSSHGVKVFGTIDQAAQAAAVGLALAPTTLIIFGNPKAGTPLMVKQPLSALDLPLKVLVTEATPGEVIVSFTSASYILKRHSLPDEMLKNLMPAERLIENAASR
jgi:uncharacterized protein (DUF302 family)